MSTHQAVRTGIACLPASDNDIDMFGVDDRLKEEMHRLAAINQELLGQGSTDSADAINC